MILFGMVGKKQAGKSTITNYLCNTHDFVELSFAYPLKEFIGRGVLGLNDRQLYGSGEDKEEIIQTWGKSSRQLLQIVGTEMFRNQIHPDIWVIAVSREIENLRTENPDVRIVISDCRFPNEVDMIRKTGGKLLRVVREGQQSTDTHYSETALDDYPTDFVVEAKSGDIKTLTDYADRLVEHHKNHGF